MVNSQQHSVYTFIVCSKRGHQKPHTPGGFLLAFAGSQGPQQCCVDRKGEAMGVESCGDEIYDSCCKIHPPTPPLPVIG